MLARIYTSLVCFLVLTGSIASKNISIDLLDNQYFNFLYEDNYGLWISSAKGYNFYKGHTTSHYILNSEDSGLEGSVIQSSLFRDTRGLLWTSTYENLCYYDPKHDQFNCDQLSIKGAIVTKGYHVLGIEGDILLVRADTFLLQYNIREHRVSKVLGATNGNRFTRSDNKIYASPWLNKKGIELWQKDKGNDWHKNIITLDACDEELRNPVIINSVIYKDQVYLINHRGLIYFNEEDHCQSRYIYIDDNESDIVDVIVYKKKILIATKSNRILVFNPNTNEWESPILLSNSANNSEYKFLYLDSYESLWVAINRVGVEELGFDDLASVDRNEDHEIGDSDQIITNQERYDHITLDRIKQYKGVKNPSAYMYLNQDSVLVRGLEDVYLCDSKQKGCSRLVGFPNKKIYSTYLEGRNLYICASDKLHLFSIDTRRFIKLNIHGQGEVTKIVHVNDKMKVLVEASSHISFRGENIDTIVNIGDYIEKVIYNSIDQSYIVGTLGGLYKLDSNFIVSRLYHEVWEMGQFSIQDLLIFGTYVYASSENGLFRFSTAYGNLNKCYVYEGNDPNDYMIMKDSIVFGSQQMLDLDFAFVDTNTYKLIIDEITIDSRISENISTDLSLAYGTSEVSIQLGLNNWHSWENSKVLYRISPSKKWQQINNHGHIQISDFHSYTYTIETKGISPDGSISPPLNFEIVVSPPWWKSNLFYIISLLGISGLLYLFHLVHTRKLKNTFQIQQEIVSLEKEALQAQMNPHFIFNCLNSIQNFIMDNEKEMAMDYLSTFAVLIRQNLQASVERRVLLPQEVSMLENYLSLEKLRFKSKFDYRIDTSDIFDKDSIYLPPMMIQPYIENAIIHAMKGLDSGGLISITFLKESKDIKVIIKDNGNGMSGSQIQKSYKSFGMSITQKRLAHNIRTTDQPLDIVSNSSGTTITIKITPLGS